MSRIGKRELVIPQGVTVTVTDNTVNVKGPKGELNYTFDKNISVIVEENVVKTTRPNDEKQIKSLHGTTNANIANMMTGVSEGEAIITVYDNNGGKSVVTVTVIGSHIKLNEDNIGLNVLDEYQFNYDILTAPPILSMFTVEDINNLYNIATSTKYSSKLQESITSTKESRQKYLQSLIAPADTSSSSTEQ